MSFTIPGEYNGEFAGLPDLSNDLLGVLNFYFTHREAESHRRSVPQESPSSQG